MKDRGFYDEANSAYVFEATNCMDEKLPKGCLMDPSNTNKKLQSYGVDCQNGDILEMILNLNQYTLRYKINGKDYGVAFEDIEKTKYRAAIFMYVYGSSQASKVGCIQLMQ